MKLILKICASLILGIGITLYLLQHDGRFKHATHEKLKNLFETMFDCVVEYKLTEIDFFTGRVQAEEVFVSGHDQSWSWKAKEFRLDISWLSLLMNGKLGLKIVINDVQVDSLLINAVPAINEHLKKLILEASDVPIILKSLSIHKGYVKLHDATQTIESFLAFSSETSIQPKRLKTSIYLTDSSISLWHIPFIQTAQMRVTFEKSDDQTNSFMQFSANGKITFDHLPYDQNDCYLAAYYDENQGWLRIHNKDHSFENDIQLYPHQQCIITSAVPIDFLNRFFISGKNVSGLCQSSITLDYANDLNVNGSFSVDNACYEGISLGTIKSYFNKNKNQWTGTALFNHATLGTMEGDWQWNDADNHGMLELTNSSTLQSPFTYWKINPHDFHIQGSFNQTDQLTGFYQLVGAHGILDTRAQTRGNFSVQDDSIKASGLFGDDSYLLLAQLAPIFNLENFSYFDNQKKNILSVGCSNKPKEINAHINYQFVRSLLKDFFDFDTRGEGVLNLKAHMADSILSGTISMSDAHIQVPETYNFIHNLNTTINLDFKNKKMVAHDTKLELYKGLITAQRATISWDDLNNNLFVHIPLLFQRIFLNFEKDLFTEFSGSVLLQKRAEQGLQVRGNILIDQGQCKKNIFSLVSQKDLISMVMNPFGQNSSIKCNLSLKTKKPIHIKTSFLQTDATLELFIKDTIVNPLVTGKISLSSGSLAFPYRSLYIARGNVYFLPHQLDDPAIELIARGKIKKYQVTLRATGSLQHPHITLESTPPLTEEQIITLLLAGSEEGSVALVMPTVIMQNLENLLFGPEQPQSRLESYFKNLLGPLKHVRVVPNFFDQTARGGFRGAFEIDVSDRLHALIQKNFSLTEDTLVEFEYLLSDDVTIRGIKDQRGDVGGEVEMRWKF